MNGNRYKHKILEAIMNHIAMFSLKKGAQIHIDAIKDTFKDKSRFNGGILSLVNCGYIEIGKRQDGEPYLVLTEKGAIALSERKLLIDNSNLFWKGAREWTMVAANVAVACVAIYALNKDTSTFVRKDDISLIQSQLDTLQLQLLQIQAQTKIHNNQASRSKTLATDTVYHKDTTEEKKALGDKDKTKTLLKK